MRVIWRTPTGVGAAEARNNALVQMQCRRCFCPVNTPTATHTLWNVSFNPGRRRAECVCWVLFQASGAPGGARAALASMHSTLHAERSAHILCKGASLSTCKYLIFDFPSRRDGRAEPKVDRSVASRRIHVHTAACMRVPTHWQRVHSCCTR